MSAAETTTAPRPGSIPSPSSGTLHLGPLDLNAYGLLIALGVIAGVWLMGKRLESKRIGTSEDAASIGLWGVVAGVIGARLYHVVTDWDRFRDNLSAIPKIWEGGLGIPGGLAFGVAAGVIVARHRRIPIGPGLNCAAPAIVLGQAIGRWGNYFNQELYGRPTGRAWALEIDPENMPAGYLPGTTFHPTFLYESIWSLLVCVALIWIDRRWKLAGGRLFALYLVGYGTGRFMIEGLRIDPAHHIAGLRLNQWVALAAVAAGLIWFFATIHTPPGSPATAAPTTSDVGGEADATQEDDAGVEETDSQPGAEPSDDGSIALGDGGRSSPSAG